MRGKRTKKEEEKRAIGPTQTTEGDGDEKKKEERDGEAERGERREIIHIWAIFGLLSKCKPPIPLLQSVYQRQRCGYLDQGGGTISFSISSLSLFCSMS